MQKYKPHTKINQCLYTLKPVLRNIIIREGRIKLRNLKLKGSKNQFGELWKVMRSHEKNKNVTCIILSIG